MLQQILGIIAFFMVCIAGNIQNWALGFGGWNHFDVHILFMGKWNSSVVIMPNDWIFALTKGQRGSGQCRRLGHCAKTIHIIAVFLERGKLF